MDNRYRLRLLLVQRLVLGMRQTLIGVHELEFLLIFPHLFVCDFVDEARRQFDLPPHLSPYLLLFFLKVRIAGRRCILWRISYFR